MSTCFYQINVSEIFYVFSSISYFLLRYGILMYGIPKYIYPFTYGHLGVISTFDYLSKGTLNIILNLIVYIHFNFSWVNTWG